MTDDLDNAERVRCPNQGSQAWVRVERTRSLEGEELEFVWCSELEWGDVCRRDCSPWRRLKAPPE